MSGEMLTGQAMPASGELATTGAAQDHAATTLPQTDGGTGGEGGNTSVPDTKTFTQKELDEIVKRAKAATESKTERRILRTLERLQPQQAQSREPQQRAAQQQDEGLARREGESESAFVQRVVKAERATWEREAEQARQQEKAQALGKKTNGLYEQAEKLGDDFDRDAFDQHITKAIAEALVESDDAARLMHYLGAHPDEMQRISQLSSARQGAELGKLEVKLAAEAKPAAPQRSNAPQALAPARGTPSSNSMPDPSDTKAYIRWANKQEMASR